MFTKSKIVFNRHHHYRHSCLNHYHQIKRYHLHSYHFRYHLLNSNHRYIYSLHSFHHHYQRDFVLSLPSSGFIIRSDIATAGPAAGKIQPQQYNDHNRNNPCQIAGIIHIILLQRKWNLNRMKPFGNIYDKSLFSSREK